MIGDGADLRDTVVVASGGIDSGVALAMMATGERAALALSFDYGQRHRRELDAARRIAAYYDVPHYAADLGDYGRLVKWKSALTNGGPVPDGHYTDASMAATVVPGRNLVMMAMAAAFAEARGLTYVVMGMHHDDHGTYPDCRPAFVEAARDAVYASSGGKVRVYAPYLRKSKADIVRIGADHGFPFALTWSCYKGGARHCGSCGTCVARKEAFVRAGVPDPTEYED